MTELNIALVGCGRISGHHARSINQVDGIRLGAVCDLVLDRASEYAKAHNVPAFESYHEMLSQVPEIDIVSINTPSGMHQEHALDMIEGYGKSVVVEKPTFMRPSQLDTVLAAANRAGVQVFPVFQNRYNKAVARVRRALQNRELGDVRTVSVRLRWCRPQRYYDLAPWRGTFSHDGGALTNQTIHHVDLLRHLGGAVRRVNTVMRTLGAEIEAEDSTVATIEYASGSIATLESTTAARPDDFEASISLVCSEGLAQIGGIAANELQIFTPDPAACAPNSEDFVGIKGHGAVYGYGHSKMYSDIVRAFDGSGEYPVSADDCRDTLKLLHAFYRSDELGGWVEVDSKSESDRLGRPDETLSEIYRTPA